MTVYYADALDECGHDVSLETEASSYEEAWADFEEQYPDLRLKNVYTREEYQECEIARYQRLEREMGYDY